MVNKKKKASRSNKSSTDRNHVMIVVGFIVALLAVMLLVKGLSGMRYSEFAEDFIELHEQAATQIPAELQGYEVATLAGGCFRCIEQPFEQLDGVVEVIVGYAGGDIENPSYKQVSSGKTKHVETAQIYYDPDVISFRQLVDFYWVLIDPSDDGWQFVDRGPQYKPIIFYHTEEQRLAAEESKMMLENAGTLDGPVRTPILPFKNFYMAEEYHQDFYTKSPDVYENYKENSWR